MQAVIQKWGNSLGFRIPSLWAKDNEVFVGSKVEVIAEKGKMIILPQKKTLENMKKDTPSTNDLINDSLKKQAEQTGLLGGK